MKQDQFYNYDIETELLSVILNDDKAANNIFFYTSDLFYNSQNKLLFDSMKILWQENTPITINTIYALLKTDIERIGGISRLSDIYSSYYTSTTYKDLIRALEDYMTRRRLKQLQNAIANGLNTNKTNSDILSTITEETDKMNNSNQIEDDGDITGALETTAINLENRMANPNKIEGITTNITDLDYALKGMKAKELIIIAARPGQGKTTLVDNFIMNITAKKKHVALFNLEMSKEQIIEKMLSNISMVENEKQQLGTLNDEDWERIAKGQNKMLLLQPYMRIYDTVMNIDHMMAIAKTLKKKNKLDLLAIDYLQLIECTTKGNREQEIAYISRTLKKIAQELDIPVIALSQLSRAPELRADHRPILSDLRESGAIEQDANKVIFLYRDEYYNKDTEEKNIIELIIAKNRNGSTKTVKCCWLPQYQRVTNLYRNK